jgi:hypothetical protein
MSASVGLPFAVKVVFPAPVHAVRAATLAPTEAFVLTLGHGPDDRTVSSKLPVLVGTVATVALTVAPVGAGAGVGAGVGAGAGAGAGVGAGAGDGAGVGAGDGDGA